jgi:hypothetical protein
MAGSAGAVAEPAPKVTDQPAPKGRQKSPFDDGEVFERGGWAEEDAVTFRPPPAPKIDQSNPFANPFDVGGGTEELGDWAGQYTPGKRKSTEEGSDYANPFD